MNHFNADDVRKIRIADYLESRNIKVKGGRCAAIWRGGDGRNVSIDTSKNCWYDHKENEGGSVIDLCMKIEGLSLPEAVDALGQRYGLAPDESGAKRPRKPKPPETPDWVKISLSITHCDFSRLTENERRWANEIVSFLKANPGATTDEAVKAVIERYHQRKEGV